MKLQISMLGSFAIITALSLSACTTINPYTREQQTSKVVKGAAIGGAAGAVVGLVSGDNGRERRKRALIGAGVGVIAGGGVGYYMDVQEAKLRQKLEGTGVSVTRVGDNLILNMPGNVTFDVNQADVKSGFYPVLDSIVDVLGEYDKTLVEINGYTDSTGSDTYNQELSQRRAGSVMQYFSSRQIPPLRLSSAGYGESRPVASNDTSEGRTLNRRVEIALLPLTTG